MKEPKDEIQWSLSPGDIHYLFGGINSNTVHKYFMMSTFFDNTSNNAIIQAQTPQILDDRAKFEDRLRAMAGIEFMVVQEPTAAAAGAGGPDQPDSGVWVIRKQERQKRPGMDDFLLILGTYFVVGERIYQAPSVSNILEARLLSITTSLSQMITLATSMTKFSLADGHSYLSAADLTSGTKPDGAAGADGDETTSAAADQPQQQQPQQQQPTAAVWDDAIFFESQQMMSRYHQDGFMDEIPLRGAPGSFIFSSTTQQLQARQARQAQAEADAKAAAAARAAQLRNPLTATASEQTAAQRVAAGAKKGRAVGKGAGLGKPKKKKPKMSLGAAKE